MIKTKRRTKFTEIMRWSVVHIVTSLFAVITQTQASGEDETKSEGEGTYTIQVIRALFCYAEL